MTEAQKSQDDAGLLEEVEGFYLLKETIPLGLTGKEHLDSIKQLKMRKDDIVLCAYAKCGTHWVWEILNMLASGSMQIKKETKVSAFLELQSAASLDQLPSPRILNTHLPPHLLPVAIHESRCRVVHVRRNPKDLTVSAYHHFKTMGSILGTPALSLEEYKQHFLQETVPYNFFKYILEIEEYLAKYATVMPSITLTFEDLKRQPVEQLRRMVVFLGKDYDETVIEHIVAASSFDKMKLADEGFKQDYPGKNTSSGESVIFRKGEIGDWKTQFTVADSETYDVVIDQYFGHTDIRFTYQ